ncbi:MAG: hypothetical protein IT562_06670 [Alphaproteobacteria bacterium]|nr:hypothetical protein [Alphaproteobacteria bacterium]
MTAPRPSQPPSSADATAPRPSPIDLVLLVGLAILFSAFSLPGIFAGLAALLLYLALRHTAGRLAVASVCLSLAFCLGVCEAVLRLGVSNPTYYRPDEVLAQFAGDGGRSHYAPDRRLDFAMPYGDLYVLSDRTARDIVEPRMVAFVTDALGYRDGVGPKNRRYVLVGDSFALGSGTTQDRILGESLRRAHGIDIYTAAFPGDPTDYARTVAWLKVNTALVRERNVVALLFEGNDFTCPGTAPPPPSIWQWRWRPVARLETYRLFYGLTRVAFGSGDLNRAVLVREIGGRSVGFLQQYIAVTKREQECDWSAVAAALAEMRPHLALVALAPTKDRVYADWLEPGAHLPQAQWGFVEATAHALGVPALDLSPVLRKRAAELLPQGRYVFWRDDTHWNAEGMDAAAEAIAAALKR